MRLASADVAAPLVVEILAGGGFAWVRESTDSMAPLVRAGDRLRLAAVDRAHVRPGDVVAYQRGACLVVHRVLACDERGVVTKGDALPERDEPVDWETVVGRVVTVAAGGKLREVTGFPWPLVGWLLAILSRLGEAAAPAAGGRWRLLAWRLSRAPVHIVARMVR